MRCGDLLELDNRLMAKMKNGETLEELNARMQAEMGALEAQPPNEVPLHAMKAALELEGMADGVDYLAAVEAALDQIPDDVQRVAAKHAWNGNVIKLGSPSALFVQGVLGFSDGKRDTLFVTAAKLEA